MFDFWQAPNHPTVGSRVRQSDCLWLFWMNSILFMCFPEMEGLCPDYHCGALRFVTNTECFPEGMKVRSWPSAKDFFPWRKLFTIPGGLRYLGRERWPQTPLRRFDQICSEKKLTLLTGWANCANILKFQGHKLFLLRNHFIDAGLLSQVCKPFLIATSPLPIRVAALYFWNTYI